MRTHALGVALLVALAEAAVAADDVVSDAWFAQFHKETKAGWSHHRRVRSTEDGKAVWITETESLLVRAAGGAMLKSPIRGSSRFVEDDAGRVTSYSTSIDIGHGPQTRQGTVADGVVSAVEDGKPRSFPYPTGALGPAAVERAILASLKPDAEGSAVEFRAIDPTSSGAVTWKVHGTTEATDVMGRYVWVDRVEKMDDSRIPDVVLVNRAGQVFGGATNFGLYQWFLTEESVAKLDAQPRSLVTSRIVAPDRAVAPRPARVVLRLSRTSGEVGALPEGEGQRIVARGKGTLDVEVTAVDPPPGLDPLPRPYAGKADMSRYLASTPVVELGNVRLQEWAAEAAGGFINSLRTARAIERYVRTCVEPAAADVGFGTACDAISGAKGDSTETAVLAAAFARASGLPSRFVAGFVYWPADTWPSESFPRGAFAPHAWTEVLVGEGVWFPIDPMRTDSFEPRESIDELAGHGGFDATHVAVVKSDLATRTPVTDIVLPALAFMDGLSIEVLEPSSDEPK